MKTSLFVAVLTLLLQSTAMARAAGQEVKINGRTHTIVLDVQAVFGQNPGDPDAARDGWILAREIVPTEKGIELRGLGVPGGSTMLGMTRMTSLAPGRELEALICHSVRPSSRAVRSTSRSFLLAETEVVTFDSTRGFAREQGVTRLETITCE